jgi:hypothetical protein
MKIERQAKSLKIATANYFYSIRVEEHTNSGLIKSGLTGMNVRN